MREIRFRGFSEQQNKWIYGSYHKPFEDITQIIENTKNNASQMSLVVNGSEGQFTGLKDKNGVEIFEGDIVKGISKQSIYEVLYIPELGGFSTRIGLVGFIECEVIGNIHENIEILNKQS